MFRALDVPPLKPCNFHLCTSQSTDATVALAIHPHRVAQEAKEREEVQEDVGEECGKYGKVEGCAVPEPPESAVRCGEELIPHLPSRRRRLMISHCLLSGCIVSLSETAS